MKLSIGNKIKALRRERGITQEQLAESIGISCLLYTSDAADD